MKEQYFIILFDRSMKPVPLNDASGLKIFDSFKEAKEAGELNFIGYGFEIFEVGEGAYAS